MNYLLFHEALEDYSRLAGKVPQASCILEGDFPVIGQGKQEVEGFTNDPGLVFRGDLTVILFGDHTAAFKFINRPFARGADGTKLFRPRTEHLDAKFAWHFLRTVQLPQTGYDRKTKYLENVEIPLPPPEEQRRIAAILDKADQLDKNRLSTIQSVEALQGSLFNEISNASMYPNKNLEQYRLSDLLEIPLRNGLSPSTEGCVEFSVLTLSAITRGRFKLESTKKGVFNSIPPREKTVNREDFLICRGNGNLNLVGLGEFPGTTDESTAFPDTMIAARLRHELVNPTYFATAWKQQSIRSQILGKSRTTNGTYKINQTCLESIVISLPSLERQATFAGRIAPLRALAEKHEASMLARLPELKSSIIDHFLYGNQ